MPILLKFRRDYADEFDVYGFEVISTKKWEQYKQVFKALEYPQEYYFGTNEFVEFESEKEILDSLEVIEITNEDVEVLKKLFKKSYGDTIEFGWIPIDYMSENISDEDYERIFKDG